MTFVILLTDFIRVEGHDEKFFKTIGLALVLWSAPWGCRPGTGGTRPLDPPSAAPPRVVLVPSQCPSAEHRGAIASVEVLQTGPASDGREVRLWSDGNYVIRDVATSPDHGTRTRDGCVDAARSAALVGAVEQVLRARSQPSAPLVAPSGDVVTRVRVNRPSSDAETLYVVTGSERISHLATEVLALTRADEDSLASNGMGNFANVVADVEADFSCAAPAGAWCAWHARELRRVSTHDDPRGVAFQLRADGRWRCATRRYLRLARGRITPESAQIALDWLQHGARQPRLEVPSPSDERVVRVHPLGSAPRALDGPESEQTLARWRPIASQLDPACALPASTDEH